MAVMLSRWFNNTFEALAVSQYRTLWFGSLFATLAFMMSFTVQAVVAFQLEGNNAAVGLVQLGLGLSMLLLGPFGGVIADRASKKPLVFVGQLVVAGSLVATGFLLVAGQMNILWLTLLTAVMGLSFAFVGPARQAWVGELVEPRLLPNAVALSQLSMNISRVVAPFLAGAMLGSAAIGAGGTYIFMGSLFLIVLVSIKFLPRTKSRPKSERRAVRTELFAGFQYVASHKTIRLLMVMFAAVVVLGFTFQVLLPALLERHFDREPTDIGLILTVNAVAALAVAVMLAGIVASKWALPAMLGAGVLLGGGFLALSVVPSFELALVTMLLVGPGLSGFMLVNNALIMANTAPEYFGRVMSLTMLAFGLSSVFALPIGLLADQVGERETLAVAGLAVLGVVALGAVAFISLAREGALSRPRSVSQPAVPRIAVRPLDITRPHGVAIMADQKRGATILALGSGD